ncbi:Chitinase 2 [Diatrype stigma]|uniref:chitinase n=1 Tax=Diatrype stigma TaxID=117547 RepID=A0AAN9UTL3_9PEZI
MSRDRVSPEDHDHARALLTYHREDIKACQAKGKTILMSLGGMTYSQGGFSDATAAQQAADQVWDLFGTNTAAANRPFGSAVVDGFDFDFEASTQNFAPFANQLRSHMDASGKTMYLSAAPQCVYPDAAMNDMLNGAVSFDFIMIQFYNNWCGVTNFQPDAAEDPYNFDVWDTWAKQTSKNPSVKVLMGVPASADAGGGYIAAAQLDPVIQYNKQFSSFGGAMMWDMSQLYTNSGFLDTVYASLNDGSAPAEPAPTSTTTTATATTTTTTTGPSPTEPSPTGAVPHWGQCGGDGYTGPTDCEAPYTCQGNEWWMSCQ